MPEISNLTNCSSVEINDLKTYLSQTPVRELVKLIDRGARVSKGEIVSLSQIGELRTIWGQLGSVYKNGKDNSEKFLVKEVMPALCNPKCEDPSGTLKCIEKYKRLFANGKLELKITLLGEGDITICDGNKRIVACYEYGLENEQSGFSLPVYVITLRQDKDKKGAKPL